MATRERIVTKDPTVTDATDLDGENHRGEMPKGEYQSVVIDTPAGEAKTVSLGQLLYAEGEKHGEVKRIVNHGNDGEGHTWEWTVYFDYTEGSEGGVPLGELATQLDEGARLAA